MRKALKKRRTERRMITAAMAVTVSCAAVYMMYRMLTRSRGTIAEIYYKTRLVRRIDLLTAEEGNFSIPELPNVVFHVCGDGSIAFVRSDCPDQICVQTGKLSRQGQIAACLINEVYVRIVSPDEVSHCDIDAEPYGDTIISEDTETSEGDVIPEDAEIPEAENAVIPDNSEISQNTAIPEDTETLYEIGQV